MILEQLLNRFAVTCTGGSFLGFPTWYKYLPGTIGPDGICSPQLTSLSAVWLIVAACIEILLRIAALAAVGFIVYAGFQYLTSQGDPNKAAQARQGIINAVVGLVIAILASAMVGFIAGRIN